MNLTTNGRANYLNAGDIVTINESDRRWWRRLWYWALRKPDGPRRLVKYRIGTITSKTTFDLEKN